MKKNLFKEHIYAITTEWTGNQGSGTSSYSAYSRDHTICADGKPPITGSADPAFRGDATRWNPEDLMVASLSACHKLWYLHLCAAAGITVLAYRDEAIGIMMEDTQTNGGRFTGVTLRPQVTIRHEDDTTLATSLHGEAHAKCFIANSVNFPVVIEPVVVRIIPQ